MAGNVFNIVVTGYLNVSTDGFNLPDNFWAMLKISFVRRTKPQVTVYSVHFMESKTVNMEFSKCQHEWVIYTTATSFIKLSHWLKEVPYMASLTKCILDAFMISHAQMHRSKAISIISSVLWNLKDVKDYGT